ncbi:rab-GTPase-TBC domain-domain-containing protein [Syncephalastrum racemosum]|uniref:Rab-GTPase-TBC domain-domain-containing protein n=1 Tax=Syncephalastrum racemosum TaxID=13706 RepID=A0A1X2HAT2_SYNRA|nr:rab-GTPase-TBC domain-domain-containing protein [Syncephalastrum racemosum]
MATLSRSSTTSRSPQNNDSFFSAVKPRNLRLRSKSFTQSPLRRQRSETNLIHRRRPSFESNQTPAKLPPPPPLPAGPVTNASFFTQQPNASSLLTVEEPASIMGGTSSIDSAGSEDEEDDDDDDEQECAMAGNDATSQCYGDNGNSNSKSNSFRQESMTTTEIPPPHKRSSSGSNHRSLATTFMDKLTLRSPKRTKSTVGLRKPLYDDGSNTIYPPPQYHASSERDQYGFVKGSQWLSLEDYREFEKVYQPIAARRLKKWRQLLSENNNHWPQPSSKFKRYIRKGIPPELRGPAWFHYSGAEQKMANNPGVYQTYVRKAEKMGLQNEFLDIIERDLHRTFPDNIKYKSTSETSEGYADVPAIQALRRVLSAFSLYSPNIGYCQSLNYIAGMLLLFMEEEQAFWTFCVTVNDILPPNVYDVTMEGANIDQTILMMLLSERCPHLWNRAEGHGMPTTSLVTSHWFLTLFINILPTEAVLRVWDCLFYEGQRALFRVALAIFKLNEHEILEVNDSLEIFQVVQNMPKRMIDCHKLMDATYNRYASLTRISQQDLDRRRALIKARRDERHKSKSGNRKLKRGTVRGTIIHKAMEARRLVERAKTVRR